MVSNAALSTIASLIKSMRSEALKKLGHTFETGFERKDDIWVLNLQDYSENDLY